MHTIQNDAFVGAHKQMKGGGGLAWTALAQRACDAPQCLGTAIAGGR